MDSFCASFEDWYDKIQNGSRVVFDWDNTLKIINRKENCLESRVSTHFLKNLIHEKSCELFILSAIRPSRMNMDTLLMEVDRLGLREYFCPLCQKNSLSLKTSEDPPSLWDSPGDTPQFLYECEIEEEQQANTSSLDTHCQQDACHVPSIQEHLRNLQSRKEKDTSEPCQHKLHSEVVNDKFHYAHWGNVIICGYDKAEVFLEFVRNQPFDSFELLPQSTQSKSPYCELDECDNGSRNKVEQKPVIFFDDEEVNIQNFQCLVENSQCVWVK